MPRSSALLTRTLHLWETRAGHALRAVGLGSVRTTIITLAVLATLIPALVTGISSYRQDRRAIQAKLAEQLSGLGAQAARETDLWLKERVYDLRVFAASYEVTDNVTRGPRQAPRRLVDYLGSVKNRFSDYDELLVVTPDGHVVASSEARPGTLHFTGDWLAHARAGDPVIGDPTKDAAGATTMEAAVPVVSASGRLLGLLAARLNFRSVEHLLRGFLTREARLIAVQREGRVIARTAASSAAPTAAALRQLLQADGAPVSYATTDGVPMIGVLVPVSRTDWSMIAEIPESAAFAEVHHLRNTAITLVLVLLAVVGALAYGLGVLIVRPLERLSGAADRVAGGDLDVQVPLVGSGELHQLASIFNDMVRRLADGRQVLETLSVTDDLTKLANRRRLMTELEREVRRSERGSHKFTVLMLDVDHFKQFNDRFGHPAGDVVLSRIAGVLAECVRDVDTAARYGGEEFTVILPEAPAVEGGRIAERIRERVAAEKFTPKTGVSESVSVSIGLAEYPTHGAAPEALIGAADQALYRAKELGRNRVAQALRASTSGKARS